MKPDLRCERQFTVIGKKLSGGKEDRMQPLRARIVELPTPT